MLVGELIDGARAPRGAGGRGRAADRSRAGGGNAGLGAGGFSRDSLQAGETVTVSGWRARNDPHLANAGSVILENGQELFTGSEGGDD